MKKKLGWKIWLLIIVVAFSLLSLFGFPPTFSQEGVIITSVDANSSSFNQGLRQGQIISRVDNQEIINLEDFSKAFEGKYSTNQSEKTIITTNEAQIILFSKMAPEITVSEIPNTNLKMGLDYNE